MKQVENSFIITGFVAKDAEIRTFTNNDVARFPMAIGRKETKDNATNRVSAFINVEAWRKSGSASFELLKKGTLLTIEGYLKPEEWTDIHLHQTGFQHRQADFIDASIARNNAAGIGHDFLRQVKDCHHNIERVGDEPY